MISFFGLFGNSALKFISVAFISFCCTLIGLKSNILIYSTIAPGCIKLYQMGYFFIRKYNVSHKVKNELRKNKPEYK